MGTRWLLLDSGTPQLLAVATAPIVLKSFGFVVTKGRPSLRHQAKYRVWRCSSALLSCTSSHSAPCSHRDLKQLLCNGEQTPRELFKKHTCKIKPMDARGKKQPETVAAVSPPFANQNTSKTPAALNKVPSCSHHVCACHGPLTHLPRAYAPHTHIDAYNEKCRCSTDVTESCLPWHMQRS